MQGAITLGRWDARTLISAAVCPWLGRHSTAPDRSGAFYKMACRLLIDQSNTCEEASWK